MPPIPGRRTVSVVIPAFNAEASIDAALESVFAQSYGDLEVVVVDDGSTDATAERLEAWRDRVRVIRQENGGPGRARNTGIRATSGSLIAFLDADDTWLPGKLARQVAYFERYPQTGFLHTATLNGAPTLLPVACPPSIDEIAPPRGSFCEIFHVDVDVNTLTVMVPRAVLERVGMFDERREIHVEDWDLWLRIAARYPVGYLSCATAVRAEGGGMSQALEKTFDGQAAVIRQNAGFCHAACPVHAAQPSDCMRRRWHRFHWERGYARLRAGNARGARASFLAALRYQPLDASTWLQLASSFLGRGARRAARTVRRAHRGKPVVIDADDRPTLVHDTLYRRARRTLTRLGHDVDDLLSSRGDRRRILFQAASPMSFVIFRPVYERIRKDPRIEFWFTAGGSTWTAEALYDRVGIHEGVISPGAATWMKVDACINSDFWDTTWLRRRTVRMHLFHGVAGKYGLDAPVGLAPIVAAYDRLFFPNEDRLDRYADAGLVRRNGKKAVLAGYPKVDRLVDGSLDTAAIKSELGFDPSAPTVVYAPTWSPHSSLNRCGETIVQLLASAGFNVIVKLHDRSYDLTPRGSGGIDWAARFAPYERCSNIRVVTDPDSTPYLAVSDAMVTDHSSVGFEFALLNRPIVILDCPELIAAARVNKSKVVELRSAAEVVATAADVVGAIECQLKAPHLHSEERQALATRYFYRPGTASARVAAVIYDVLGLSASAAPLETAQGTAAAVPTAR